MSSPVGAAVPALLAPRAHSPCIRLTILGQVYSKANRRELVTRRYRDDADQLRTRPQLIKSQQAREYERAALLQIPVGCRQRLTGPVRVTMRIFYTSERPDLDESIVLDVLQDRFEWVRERGRKVRRLLQAGVFRNDRQVRGKLILWGIDKINPRAEILVEPMTAQQAELSFDAPGVA